MAKITLDIPDDLLDQLTQVGDRLPDLLRLSLEKPVLPAGAGCTEGASRQC